MGMRVEVCTARSLIPPFECKAVIDLIVGMQLQRQSEIHWPLSLTRSREWNMGVVEVQDDIQ